MDAGGFNLPLMQFITGVELHCWYLEPKCFLKSSLMK